jgi:hypothetical protein
VGEFPPRQANSGLVEDPGLRRAASMIAVIAGIARDRKCKTYHRGMENSQGRKIGNVGEIGRDRESKTLPVSTPCYFGKPALRYAKERLFALIRACAPHD